MDGKKCVVSTNHLRAAQKDHVGCCVNNFGQVWVILPNTERVGSEREKSGIFWGLQEIAHI